MSGFAHPWKHGFYLASPRNSGLRSVVQYYDAFANPRWVIHHELYFVHILKIASGLHILSSFLLTWDFLLSSATTCYTRMRNRIPGIISLNISGCVNVSWCSFHSLSPCGLEHVPAQPPCWCPFLSFLVYLILPPLVIFLSLFSSGVFSYMFYNYICPILRARYFCYPNGARCPLLSSYLNAFQVFFTQ